MTHQPTVEVITTVRVGAHTKTFTSTATTNGDEGRAARNLAQAQALDVCDWTRDVEASLR